MLLSTPREIAAEIGARLRTQRLAQSLRREDLAAQAGVSPGAVKNLETTGRSTVETLVRVCVALGLQGEFNTLFVVNTAPTFDDLERAERVQQRKRAPRRRSSP